jgi:hypothetical protein
MSDLPKQSLRDYDSSLYGPFLGISDDGSAAEAICHAALDSAKAQALDERDPLAVGVAHDAERLRSIGEVPVGPDDYARILECSAGRVLLTTNVGSHVNVWHYLQPPEYEASSATTAADLASWAREHGSGLRERCPEPWLRVRLGGEVSETIRRELVRSAAAEAPVAVVVRADDGADALHIAIDLAADAGARAVVVDGIARAPTEGRPALPGLLNYFDASETRDLLRASATRGVALEPALKIDTDSVANQVWTGLHAARTMGLHLGKYGLFPLTFQEMEPVVEKVQRWTKDWTAAPAFYVDVPWLDGTRVYELADAAQATSRWLELMAGRGVEVVLIDTVDKSQGRHLVRASDQDTAGIFSWEQLEELDDVARKAGIRVLWAGGIPLAQVREFGRRKVFGIYVTTAAAELQAPTAIEQHDIGLVAAKRPVAEKIALVKMLIDAGFLAAARDAEFEQQARAAEQGDTAAQQRLAHLLTQRWRERIADQPRRS